MVGRLKAYRAVVSAIGFVVLLVLAAERPAVALLALGPMLAAYLLLRGETRAVLDRQDAERTARREAGLRAQEQAVARKLKETDQMKDDLLALAPDPVLQILGNLVDNACKYSHEDHPVWLLGERDGSDAVLAVEDDGPGVPPEERERVFERGARFELRLPLRAPAEQLLPSSAEDRTAAPAGRPRPGPPLRLTLPARRPAPPA
jgi:Histidine kinase-, DNA gyrase B-, and HSP90-like ATPase